MNSSTVKKSGQILVFFMLLFSISNSYAKELLIAFTLDAPPFVINKGVDGIEVEVVREALKYTGHTFQVLQMSHKKFANNIKNRGTDATVNMLQSDDGSYYSDKYIKFNNFAFTRIGSGISIDKIADLKGKRIVAWGDAYQDLGPEFKALFSPKVKAPYREKYIEVSNQADQVRMFWSGEADVAVMDKAIMLYYSKQLGDNADISKLVYNKIFSDITEFQVSFKEKKIRDDFNRGLKHIRKNGIYEKIYAKYGLSP